MISIKSTREIEAMRRAGRLTAQARALAGSMVRPGVTTREIDTAVRRFIESHGAKPSFLGYGGFPAPASGVRKGTSSAWTWGRFWAGSMGTAPPPTPADRWTRPLWS